MKLGADVGGTKTLLEARAGAFTLLRRRYENAAFADFDSLLATFLAELRAARPAPITAACFAVAGPVDSERAKLTNGPCWQLDTEALQARVGIERVALVNDFLAVIAGLETLGPADLRELQPGRPARLGVRLAVGPGTGCGVGISAGEVALPSEGGHAAFAPFDESSLRLWQQLGGPTRFVPVEAVLSGEGLGACYQLSAGPTATRIAPSDVTTRAEAGEPAACTAVRLFARCLGAFAGDLALACLPRGGVYLAGGIPARLPARLFDEAVLEGFLRKGNCTVPMRDFPLHLVCCDDVGLRGALRIAGDFA